MLCSVGASIWLTGPAVEVADGHRVALPCPIIEFDQMSLRLAFASSVLEVSEQLTY